MFAQGSIFSLALHGSWFSLFILIILVLMSVIGWGVILMKVIMYNKEISDSKRFIKLFQSENKLNQTVTLANRFPDAYTARQYKKVHREFSRFTEKYPKEQRSREQQQDMIHRLERVLDKSIGVETKELEKGLIVLATISSAAPFIGLLGTVVGIINSFHSIGTQGAASLAVVAPGISEALIATAFGLFAAIPALMGYNYLRNQVRKIGNDMRHFSLDLINAFAWAY
ncbi:MAG: biopolymer transport protein TolQ [bacterium]|jgi:biopolymer transport protein TolQ